MDDFDAFCSLNLNGGIGENGMKKLKRYFP